MDAAVELHADLVSCTLQEQRLRRAAISGCRSGEDSAAGSADGGLIRRDTGIHKFLNGIHHFYHAARIRRDTVFFIAGGYPEYLVPSLLEFRRNCITGLSCCNSETDQGRRDIKIFKTPAHRILAANSANTKVNLSHKGAKHSRRGLAPTAGIFPELLEIFLERQIGFFPGEA